LNFFQHYFELLLSGSHVTAVFFVIGGVATIDDWIYRQALLFID